MRVRKFPQSLNSVGQEESLCLKAISELHMLELRCANTQYNFSWMERSNWFPQKRKEFS